MPIFEGEGRSFMRFMLIWSWSSEYHRDALSQLAIRDLAPIVATVCNDVDRELTACDGEDNYVHLLVVYPAKVALAKLVNSLRGVSSRRLQELRPELRGRYRRGVLWSPS
jgi:putative transposase